MAKVLEDYFGVTRCETCAAEILCNEFSDMPDVCPVCKKSLDWSDWDSGEHKKSDDSGSVVLDNSDLRRCCGENPVFRYFIPLRAWAIECKKNGHIENTGFCDSAAEAARKWNAKELA